MQKKNIIVGRFYTLALVTAIILFTAGCKQDNDDSSDHTDTAFLEGTWANANGTSFTIAADLSFECELYIPVTEEQLVKALVKGSLDAVSAGLGPNDYIIRNMETTGSDDNYPANTYLKLLLGAFQDLLITLAPNAAKTQFTFSSANGTAAAFFGGDYYSQIN